MEEFIMALKKADTNPMGVTVDPAAVSQTAEETNTPPTETPAAPPEKPAETPVETSPETQPDPTPAPEPEKFAEPETPVVEIPETPATPPVEVNPAPAPETNIPKVEPQVRIRMARDHRCTIAMKFYDLKKGQCYNVPTNVKRVLNNAGLLAPL